MATMAVVEVFATMLTAWMGSPDGGGTRAKRLDGKSFDETYKAAVFVVLSGLFASAQQPWLAPVSVPLEQAIEIFAAVHSVLRGSSTLRLSAALDTSGLVLCRGREGPPGLAVYSAAAHEVVRACSAAGHMWPDSQPRRSLPSEDDELLLQCILQSLDNLGGPARALVRAWEWKVAAGTAFSSPPLLLGAPPPVPFPVPVEPPVMEPAAYLSDSRSSPRRDYRLRLGVDTSIPAVRFSSPGGALASASELAGEVRTGEGSAAMAWRERRRLSSSPRGRPLPSRSPSPARSSSSRSSPGRQPIPDLAPLGLGEDVINEDTEGPRTKPTAPVITPITALPTPPMLADSSVSAGPPVSPDSVPRSFWDEHYDDLLGERIRPVIYDPAAAIKAMLKTPVQAVTIPALSLPVNHGTRKRLVSCLKKAPAAASTTPTSKPRGTHRVSWSVDVLRKHDAAPFIKGHFERLREAEEATSTSEPRGTPHASWSVDVLRKHDAALFIEGHFERLREAEEALRSSGKPKKRFEPRLVERGRRLPPGPIARPGRFTGYCVDAAKNFTGGLGMVWADEVETFSGVIPLAGIGQSATNVFGGDGTGDGGGGGSAPPVRNLGGLIRRIATNMKALR